MEKQRLYPALLRPGQADKYYADCFQKEDPEVNRLTGASGVFGYDRVSAYYNRVAEDPDRFDFIIIAPDGRFIGESVINEIDWDTRSANYRIVLFHSENCSWGIGTWAVRKTRDFAFGVLGLHRLELDVFSFNPWPNGFAKKRASGWRASERTRFWTAAAMPTIF